MNLLELKKFTDRAIENTKEFGENPEEVIVSIQINGDENTDDIWSDDIELIYDNNGMASGCVLHGWSRNQDIAQPEDSADWSAIQRDFERDIYNQCDKEDAEKLNDG